MTLITRDIESYDVRPLLALNNAAIPAVNLLDERTLIELVSMAHAAAVVVEEDDPKTALGLVITLTSGNDYDSENYRWFEARSHDFLYVDRIVVDESFRARGLGQVLYERVFAEARSAGLTEVTCEVNLDPPNPGSLAFHDRLGFVQVGELVTKNATVTVALLAAPVALDPVTLESDD